ncbi:hypothetical protein JYU14_01390 [Simkania negevensis]|uniref:Uncharacterized protein n=1 Tax=Simkania negevensis TaxID=83561 RepID=A0ABS3AT75_9BACT|nr:hypothetical protein [Simkania negevensis]
MLTDRKDHDALFTDPQLYLEQLALHLFNLLGLYYKPLLDYYFDDLGVIHQAYQRLYRRNHHPFPNDELADIGGEELYNEIILEVKEYTFLFESPGVRAGKQRLSKEKCTRDYLYLKEGYELLVHFYNTTVVEMKKLYPHFNRSQANLALLTCYLERGTFSPPPETLDLLVRRYLPLFNSFEKKVTQAYNKLSRKWGRVKRVSLDEIALQGIQGIRGGWSRNPALKARIVFNQLGLSNADREIFTPAFLDRVWGQRIEEELALYNYIKSVNSLLYRVTHSKARGASTEMEAALEAYVKG